MSGLEKAQKLRYVTVDVPPLRSLLPALFLVLGILGGYIASGRCAKETAAELAESVMSYLASAGGRERSGEMVLRTVLCFVRAPALAFLLGFASVGAIGIPLLMGLQGFVSLLGLFGLRLLFVLPCTLYLASAALEKSWMLAAMLSGDKHSRPSYGLSYWIRFAVCLLLLLLGSALELWSVPLLMAGNMA